MGKVRTPAVATGRPRDPGVDLRVTEAAAELYGELGWAGFTIDAVARRAGVGKASIYLRWSSKEELLVDAFQSDFLSPATRDTGTIRGDLLELATQLYRLHVGPWGRVALRLTTEQAGTPELLRRRDEYLRARTAKAQLIIQRGIDRGELPPDVPGGLIIECLSGAVTVRAITAPARGRAKLEADIETYPAEVVDFLLRDLVHKEAKAASVKTRRRPKRSAATT